MHIKKQKYMNYYRKFIEISLKTFAIWRLSLESYFNINY